MTESGTRIIYSRCVEHNLSEDLNPCSSLAQPTTKKNPEWVARSITCRYRRSKCKILFNNNFVCVILGSRLFFQKPKYVLVFIIGASHEG